MRTEKSIKPVQNSYEKAVEKRMKEVLCFIRKQKRKRIKVFYLSDVIGTDSIDNQAIAYLILDNKIGLYSGYKNIYGYEYETICVRLLTEKNEKLF